MPLFHVNVPKYDDVLNNKNVCISICWKLLKLEVIHNQADTNKTKWIISNHFELV